MAVDQDEKTSEKPTRERCLSCLCWHEPGDHQIKSIPVTLTGQVPVGQVPVSGNSRDDS